MSMCKIVKDKRLLQGKDKSFESDKLTYYECWILIFKGILIFILELEITIYLKSNNFYVHFAPYNLNIKSFCVKDHERATSVSNFQEAVLVEWFRMLIAQYPTCNVLSF